MSTASDKVNSKALMVSFLGAAALAFIVTRVLFDTLGGMFAPVERLRSILAVYHGLPLGVAATTFLVLQLNPRVRNWGEEVVTEIRKIVWPSQRDTVTTTIAVCVMVVVAGVGLSLIDYVSSLLIKAIVN